MPLTQLSGISAILILCGLLLAEEAGIPLPLLPGDLIAITGGYLLTTSAIPAAIYLPAAYLAIVLGALTCYHLSSAVRKGVGRSPRRARLLPRQIRSAAAWFCRQGAPGVFLARILPGTRIAASFAAGGAGMERKKFMLGVLPSAAVWLLGFTALGVAAGRVIAPYVVLAEHAGTALILVASCLLLLAALASTLLGKKRGAMPQQTGWLPPGGQTRKRQGYTPGSTLDLNRTATPHPDVPLVLSSLQDPAMSSAPLR